VSDEKRSPLVDLWQNEINGAASSFIRHSSVFGSEQAMLAAAGAYANGASLEVVLEHLSPREREVFLEILGTTQEKP
jgi:hypothetical protein